MKAKIEANCDAATERKQQIQQSQQKITDDVPLSIRRSRSYVGMLGSGDSCSRTGRNKPYENPNPDRETPAGVHTLIEASNSQPQSQTLPQAKPKPKPNPKGNLDKLHKIEYSTTYAIPHGTSAAHAKVAAEAATAVRDREERTEAAAATSTEILGSSKEIDTRKVRFAPGAEHECINFVAGQDHRWYQPATPTAEPTLTPNLNPNPIHNPENCYHKEQTLELDLNAEATNKF
jgi:hypothetical protein